MTERTGLSGRMLVLAAAMLAIGLIVGGFLLGDGLRRAQSAERSVTVRGLAERDVTADLATWSISYSATGTDLASVQADVDADTRELRAYFGRLGFPAAAITPAGAGVNQYLSNGVLNITINQRLLLRTNDIARARAAVARQFELVQRGVTLQEGSGMRYTFTRLNDVKPAMVADATRDARQAAEQFARDSGTGVGGIKSATQGYFTIDDRDGDGGDSPFKKVRVVTTVDFYLK